MNPFRSIATLLILVALALPGCSGSSDYESTDTPQPRDDREQPERKYTDAEVEALIQKALVDFPASSGSDDPNCSPSSLSRKAVSTWKAFRATYPYHVQTMALTKPNASGNRVLIVSEPPAHLSRGDWNEAICSAFPGTIQSLRRQRHKVGYDGWVEDIVVELKALDSAQALEAGIEALNLAMFDTLYKTHAVALPTRLSGPMNAGGPSLEVSAAEVRSWLIEGRTPLVAHETGERRTFDEVADEVLQDVWFSEDGTLVLWLIDRTEDLSDKRGMFRVFALESDAIVGALARGDDALAIVGRARQTRLDQNPPLRFEEVLGLARSAAEEELAQSYERNLPFAGKIFAEKGRDWAPILLSDSLIDTEFGSLLNITDQMLKSWSQAGTVEYIDFPYPKPERSPFEAPLSDVLNRRFGTSSVLFNWNTSGVGAAYPYSDFTVYSVLNTGALPVTYGSDMGTPDEVEDLQEYEDRAYEYFVELENPYLARVVQYTALYQIFHEYRCEAGHGQVDAASAHLARRELRDRVRKAIDVLRSGNGAPSADFIDFVLAGADESPFGTPSRSELEKEMGEWLKRAGHLFAAVDKHFGSEGLDVFADVLADPRSVPTSETAWSSLELLIQRVAMEVRQDESLMELPGSDFRRAVNEKIFEAIAERPGSRQHLLKVACFQLGRDVTRSFVMLPGLRDVRDSFAAASKHEPAGSIRTASLVLSWSTNNVAATGGHNLNSKLTQIPLNRSVQRGSARVRRSEKGVQVEINPADAKNSHRVRRIVERNAKKSDREIADLVKRELSIDRPVRAARAALDAPTATFRPGGIDRSMFGSQLEVFPRAAARRVDSATKRKLVARAEAENIDVMVARSDAGDLVLLDRSGTSTMVEPVLTNPQLVERLKKVTPKEEKALNIRIEGMSEGSADAVIKTLQSGGGAGGRLPPTNPIQAGASDPGHGFSFAWLKSRKRGGRGDRGTFRKTDGQRIDAPVLAKLRNMEPDWSQARIKDSARLSPDRQEVALDVELPSRSRLETPLDLEVAAKSKAPFTETRVLAFEAVTEQVLLGESAARNLTIPEATRLLKKTLVDRLGIDAVETKLIRGELKDIQVGEKECPKTAVDNG